MKLKKFPGKFIIFSQFFVLLRKNNFILAVILEKRKTLFLKNHFQKDCFSDNIPQHRKEFLKEVFKIQQFSSTLEFSQKGCFS
jgi:hypothetical protein